MIESAQWADSMKEKKILILILFGNIETIFHLMMYFTQRIVQLNYNPPRLLYLNRVALSSDHAPLVGVKEML